MRKIYLLFTAFAFIAGLSTAKAETVSPYSYGFDGLDVSEHDFAPTGWNHIVDSYSGDYVSYTAYDEGGQDGGAYLGVGSQELGYSWDAQEVFDLLVTPPVSGDVSFYAKQSSSSGSVEIYTVTKNGFQYEMGAAYEVELPALSTTEWTQIVIPSVPEGTMLGIRGQNVGIDSFSAASAEIELKKAMAITEIVGEYENYAYINADAEGNVTFKFTVKVQNTGETVLNPGDEGYAVDIINNTKDNAVVGTAQVPVALQPGETSEAFDVVAHISGITEPGENYWRFDLRENLTGVETYYGWYYIYAYLPMLEVAIDDTYNTVENGTTVDFGTSREPVEKLIYILNDEGGAPLNVTSIDMPEGFSYTLNAVTDNNETGEPIAGVPFEIAAHGKALMTVTMTTDVVGTRSGNISIATEGAEPFVMPVAGVVVDPSKLFVNFEDQKFPEGTYNELDDEGEVHWAVKSVGTYSEPNYAADHDRVGNLTKFVLPKMKAEEGDVMSFRAAMKNTGVHLNVLYSADRKSWTTAKAISEDAANEADRFSDEGYTNNYEFKTFTVDNIPAGEWYVAFEGDYVRVDDIMGYTLLEVPDYDLIVEGASFPSTAMVNYASTASATIVNIGKADVKEGELTAKIYLNDEEAASASVPAIASGESATIAIAFTPHQAGTTTIRMAVEGVATADATAEMTVAEETTSSYVQVGEGSSLTSGGPFKFYNKRSITEIIYPKEAIGIPAGTKILGLTFKGYYSGKNAQSNINVYIANEQGTAFKGYDVTGMTQYSGVFDMTNGGGSSSNSIDVIAVTFPEGIVYNGENIRIVTTAESDGWQSVYFEVDNNYSSAAQQKASDSYNSLEELEASASWSALSYMPVVYFAVEKDATTISGTVTAKESGTAIEGAEVKLISGDVEYNGTTDAEGHYEVTVIQDALTYNMEVAKEGYFTYRSNDISFAEGSAVKDVEMDEATGINIVSVSIPTEGEVNSTMTVKANIENGLEKEAGSYTAVLYVDGVAAAEAEAVALEAFKSYDFEFVYTPHAEGEVSAYVEFKNEYNTATSEPQTIAIAAESADAEVRVGTPATFDRTGATNFYYKYSQTEIIYPKELINLDAGVKILSISFKGYTESRTADPVVNVWIGNVPEGSALQGEDVTELTQVTPEYGTMVTIEPAGSESEPISIISIDIPDGFTYEGGDIRIFTQSEADAWTYTNYEIDNTVQGQAQQRQSDSSIDNASWSGISMPVVYFGIVPTKNISGTVTFWKDKAPAEGAKVTLRSGEVEYYGTTEADGTYSIDVIKHSLVYDMIVSLEGYEDTVVEGISFAEGDVVKDAELIEIPVYPETMYVMGDVVADADLEMTAEGEGVYTIEDVEISDAGEGYGFIKFAESTDSEETYGPAIDGTELVAGTAGDIAVNGNSYKVAVAVYDIKVDLTNATVSLTWKGASVNTTDADALNVYGSRGAIVVESPDARRVTVYDLSGRAVRIAEVEAGKTTLDGFNAGIYIVERKKVAVR